MSFGESTIVARELLFEMFKRHTNFPTSVLQLETEIQKWKTIFYLPISNELLFKIILNKKKAHCHKRLKKLFFILMLQAYKWPEVVIFGLL